MTLNTNTNIDLSGVFTVANSKIALPFFGAAPIALLSGANVGDAIEGVHLLLGMCRELAGLAADQRESAENINHTLTVLLALCHGITGGMSTWADTSTANPQADAEEQPA